MRLKTQRRRLRRLRPLRCRSRAMPDITIAVTALDSYRYYVESDMSLEQYIARLKRLEPPHPRAVLGTAMHDGISHLVKTGSYSLLDKTFHIPAEIHLRRPDVMEVKVGRTFEVDGRRVRVSGRVDALMGQTLVDYKTTQRIDLDYLMDSLQWRVYMSLLPDVEAFRYEVFQLSKNPNKLGKYAVNHHTSVDLARYPDLESDVYAAVMNYDRFLRQMARWGYITLTPYGVERG